MAVQRVAVTLTELRCLAQSESGNGSEPYLWTTFFAFGAEQIGTQPGIFGIKTPSYDQFRTEFPDGIKAGRVATVPVFIASGSFDFDLDAVPQPKLFGAIAVLMEEDSTPQQFMVQGRIAYSKEIEVQLQALGRERLLSGNLGPLTDAEAETIKQAVKAKVTAAVGRGQTLGALFRNQDDNLGFMFKLFTHRASDPANSEIKRQSFTFPEVNNGDGDRFVLSGTMSLGAVPKPPIVLCKPQRAALKAKQDKIASLQNQRARDQARLATATPQQKSALIASIRRLADEIAVAEAALPGLQQALDACLGSTLPGGVLVTTGTVLRRDKT